MRLPEKLLGRVRADRTVGADTVARAAALRSAGRYEQRAGSSAGRHTGPDRGG
ncbi:hypothetical protein [Streptomyces sp. NPDC020377]|uniref:hypothetical protein n=1 Tax=Streptomyces sp. NPDC020377 TaxID=3365070 RepID=UPI0037B37422